MTTLETLCLVIVMDLARKNCEEMQAEADRNHCKLRPHVKTHKMPRFAQMQLEAGASGIICCKVSEGKHVKSIVTIEMEVLCYLV